MRNRNEFNRRFPGFALGMKLLELSLGGCTKFTAVNGARRRRAVTRPLVAMALFACGASVGFAQPGSLKHGGMLIGPDDLPQDFAPALQILGGRLSSADRALVNFSGTVTDASGTRTGQISVQAPGLLLYQEGQGRKLTFDGAQFQSKNGALTVDDNRLIESLLAHSADAILLQLAAGGGLRRVGSHFRTDDGKAKAYQGPFLTLYAYSPAPRKGLSRGQPLQQDLFIAMDEATWLIREIRVANKPRNGQETITQTKLNNWTRQGGQYYPGEIVRLENGQQVLRYLVQQTTLGAAVDPAAFKQ